ncbi:MAG: TlpA family protein disulfide reductase [Bacteroidia bacterium]
MRFITFSILFIIAINCNGQHIQVIKFNELKQRVFNQSDTTYVLNFFASWCAPCLKEIPAFLQLIDSSQNSKTKVLLVSVDFKTNAEKNLEPIINKYQLPPIYLLDEPNGNIWINEIDNNWSGAIPATLVVKKNKKRKFIVTSLTYPKLIKLIR